MSAWLIVTTYAVIGTATGLTLSVQEIRDQRARRPSYHDDGPVALFFAALLFWPLFAALCLADWSTRALNAGLYRIEGKAPKSKGRRLAEAHTRIAELEREVL